MQIAAATHADITAAAFETIVSDWIAQAKHPTLERPYTELVYQPMLDLPAYLRGHGFKTFIVSGGGIEFMRPWTEAVYGIPPEQVIGSSIKTEYRVVDGAPVLMRLPEVDFIDNKEGKPVGIHSHIGRRPVMAFGNSDGDRQMLDWTAAGAGARFAAIVLHDDAAREFAYGPANGLPATHVGAFTQDMMDHARASGDHVIRMKTDWATIFPAPR